MRTFFFGYLSLKWQRLFRTLSILFLIPNLINIIEKGSLFTYGYVQYNNYGLVFSICAVLFIPLISYLVQPFIDHAIKDQNDKVNEPVNPVFNINSKFQIEVINNQITEDQSQVSELKESCENDVSSDENSENTNISKFNKGTGIRVHLIKLFINNRLIYHIFINLVVDSYIAYKLLDNVQKSIKLGTFNGGYDPNSVSGKLGVILVPFVTSILVPLLVSLIVLKYSHKAYKVVFLVLMYLFLLFQIISLAGMGMHLNRIIFFFF